MALYLSKTLAKVTQYKQTTVPKLAKTYPDKANMGLLMVVRRVPKIIMRAGDRRSASVPLRDLDALDRNWAMA